MTLSTKMFLGFGLVIAIVAASAVLTVVSLKRIQDISVVAAKAAENSADVYNLKYQLWDVRLGVMRLLVDKNDEATKKLEAAKATLAAGLEEIEPNIAENLKEKFEPYKAAIIEYDAAANDLMAAAANQDWDKATEIRQQRLVTAGAEADETSNAAVDEAKTLVTDSREDRRKLITSATVTNYIASGLALALAIIVMFILLNAVRKPLAVLASAAHTMSTGDYSVVLAHSKVKDEIGKMTESFIEMKNNTKHLIEQVGNAATSVASSSEELAAGADETGRAIQQVTLTIQEVAKGAQDTTHNVSRTQQNVDQTAKAIEGVSRDIEDVAAYATQAAAQGSEGKQSADDAVKLINRAAESVQSTAKVVQNLGEKTKQIGEFIGIITGIADQTNLLALNAAIEAARAGDAGRGFAVVAEEVRKLAEESNTAAGNITNLVKSIEGEMTTALSAMERSSKEVEDGATTVSQASSMLTEIVKGVDALNGRVQGISAAAEEINASTTEVVHAMQSVAAVAEESAAASEEVSSAAEEQTASMEEISASAATLARLAQDLQGLISKFKV
jgi:methyl-accepting chemotaxis protein